MMRRLLIATFAAFVAVSSPALRADDKPEPRYEGKTLAYWVNRLQTAENDEDRYKAAQAIEAFGPDAAPAVPALVEMLDDRSERFREIVGGVLCSLGPAAKAAAPVLVRSLREKTARTPRVVIGVLGCIGPDASEAVPELIKAARKPQTSPTPPRNRSASIGPAAKRTTRHRTGRPQMEGPGPRSRLRGLCLSHVAAEQDGRRGRPLSDRVSG